MHPSTTWWPRIRSLRGCSCRDRAARDHEAPVAARRASGAPGQDPDQDLGEAADRLGQPVTTYTQAELVSVICWIESDSLLRTEADLLKDAMSELGWHRRESRIDAGLRAVIAAARR